MSTGDMFGEIQKSIEEKQQATPRVQPAAVGAVGTVVSKPGTERVTLDASNFQFLECESSAVGYNKKRYCIVEKGICASYQNQFITSAGDRAHVVTREVYNLMLGVVNNVSRQIRQLTGELALAKEKTDLYKLTIDALRKNGIID